MTNIKELPAVEERVRQNVSQASPSKLALDSFKELLSKCKLITKDKNKLILILVLPTIWFSLNVLYIKGINIEILNFITFAQGGINAGWTGIVGGIIAKAYIAYFFFALLIPLIKKEISIPPLPIILKETSPYFYTKNILEASQLLWGVGIAFILFNFMVGNVKSQNSMIAIILFILCIRILLKQEGFLKKFFTSIMARFGVANFVSIIIINRVIAGFTLGFFLSFPIAFTNLNIIGYIIGIPSLIVSMSIWITGSNRKVVE
jgi:hypothetical protein